jgi:hypothetical protein
MVALIQFVSVLCCVVGGGGERGSCSVSDGWAEVVCVVHVYDYGKWGAEGGGHGEGLLLC